MCCCCFRILFFVEFYVNCYVVVNCYVTLGDYILAYCGVG